MNKINFAYALSLTLATTLLAQGPGGGGGGGTIPGGNQPGGGSSGAFTYDTFLTSASVSGNAIVYAGLWTGYSNSPTAFTLSATVTNAVAGVMAGCATLTSANLASATALSALPAHAFAGCTALTTVTLPATITSIGEGAFEGCTALKSLTAAGVTAIGANAFRGCTALTSQPSGTTLGAYAFAQSGLISADLASKTLGAGVCAGCLSLASATFGTTVPAATFSGCTALTGCALSNATSIGAAAFASLGATNLVLNSSATLGAYAFAADTATLATTLTFTGNTLATDDETTYLGRSLTASYTPIAGELCRVEAYALVTWLMANHPLTSYTTSAVETWLNASATNGLSYAYASVYSTNAAFQPLTVSGATFLWTRPDSGSTDAMTITLLGSTNLSDWSEGILAESTTNGEVYTVDSPRAFARLRVTPNW